jgi:DNA invertase Pin-like site-specific DNA recombinase
MSPRVTGDRVVGYVRVSTEDQAENGAGLAAQRAAIEAECKRRGWQLAEVVADEAVSGGVPFAERPGGRRVLELLRRGEVGGLVAPKLDRLTRSMGDAENVLERFKAAGWVLTLLDLGVDTSTPMGEAMAGVAAVFAKLERRLIGQRTREALNAKRQAGVRLGRPPVEADVAQRIMRRRRAGRSFTAIAEELTADEVPLPGRRSMGPWAPSTVRNVARRHMREPVRRRAGRAGQP